MRRLAALGAVLLLAAARPAGAQQAGGQRPRDAFFGADKLKHFALAFFVQSAGYSVMRVTGAGHGSSVGVASGLTAAVSVAKEWRDRRTTGFSTRDLVWDAAGAGAATLLLRRTAR